jgi:hypothetical protein
MPTAPRPRWRARAGSPRRRGRAPRPRWRGAGRLEAVAAEESHERHAEALREGDGQRRRRAHGAEHRHPREGGLLHELEARAAGEHHEGLVEGPGAVEQHAAEGLVEGVVAADVFAHDAGRAVGGKHPRGVQAPGGFEGGLRGTEPRRAARGGWARRRGARGRAGRLLPPPGRGRPCRTRRRRWWCRSFVRSGPGRGRGRGAPPRSPRGPPRASPAGRGRGRGRPAIGRCPRRGGSPPPARRRGPGCASSPPPGRGAGWGLAPESPGALRRRRGRRAARRCRRGRRARASGGRGGGPSCGG